MNVKIKRGGSAWNAKEEKIATVSLDITRFSVWLHSITILSTYQRQKDSKVEGSYLPTSPSIRS